MLPMKKNLQYLMANSSKLFTTCSLKVFCVFVRIALDKCRPRGPTYFLVCLLIFGNIYLIPDVTASHKLPLSPRR